MKKKRKKEEEGVEEEENGFIDAFNLCTWLIIIVNRNSSFIGKPSLRNDVQKNSQQDKMLIPLPLPNDI